VKLDFIECTHLVCVRGYQRTHLISSSHVLSSWKLGKCTTYIKLYELKRHRRVRMHVRTILREFWIGFSVLLMNMLLYFIHLFPNWGFCTDSRTNLSLLLAKENLLLWCPNMDTSKYFYNFFRFANVPSNVSITCLCMHVCGWGEVKRERELGYRDKDMYLIKLILVDIISISV